MITDQREFLPVPDQQDHADHKDEYSQSKQGPPIAHHLNPGYGQMADDGPGHNPGSDQGPVPYHTGYQKKDRCYRLRGPRSLPANRSHPNGFKDIYTLWSTAKSEEQGLDLDSSSRNAQNPVQNVYF